MGKKEKNKTIFLSYANADEPMAQWLVKNLEKHAKVWTGRGFAMGAYWATRIEKAISEAQLVLLLITPDFLSSPVANLEAGIALRHSWERQDLSVISVLTNGVTPDQLPPLLRHRNLINASQKSRDELLKAIERRLISQPAGDGASASQVL